MRSNETEPPAGGRRLRRGAGVSQPSVGTKWTTTPTWGWISIRESARVSASTENVVGAPSSGWARTVQTGRPSISSWPVTVSVIAAGPSFVNVWNAAW